MTPFKRRTVSLELRPDMWADLERRAARLGLTIDQYLQSCIELNIPTREGADQR